jgi:hypothetical protein
MISEVHAPISTHPDLAMTSCELSWDDWTDPIENISVEQFLRAQGAVPK